MYVQSFLLSYSILALSLTPLWAMEDEEFVKKNSQILNRNRINVHATGTPHPAYLRLETLTKLPDSAEKTQQLIQLIGESPSGIRLLVIQELSDPKLQGKCYLSEINDSNGEVEARLVVLGMLSRLNLPSKAEDLLTIATNMNLHTMLRWGAVNALESDSNEYFKACFSIAVSSGGAFIRGAVITPDRLQGIFSLPRGSEYRKQAGKKFLQDCSHNSELNAVLALPESDKVKRNYKNKKWVALTKKADKEFYVPLYWAVLGLPEGAPEREKVLLEILENQYIRDDLRIRAARDLSHSEEKEISLLKLLVLESRRKLFQPADFQIMKDFCKLSIDKQTAKKNVKRPIFLQVLNNLKRDYLDKDTLSLIEQILGEDTRKLPRNFVDLAPSTSSVSDGKVEETSNNNNNSQGESASDGVSGSHDDNRDRKLRDEEEKNQRAAEERRLSRHAESVRRKSLLSFVAGQAIEKIHGIGDNLIERTKRIFLRNSNNNNANDDVESDSASALFTINPYDVKVGEQIADLLDSTNETPIAKKFRVVYQVLQTDTYVSETHHHSLQKKAKDKAGNLHTLWAMNLTGEDRLVYYKVGNVITIISVKGHYEDL